MPRALRVCSTPGCPTLTDAGRCAVHAQPDRHSSRNHRGVPRQARGHGAAYDRARAQLRGRPCALRLEGCTGLSTSADYTRPGDWTSPLQPACLHCQSVQGGRLAAAARR